jgi:hypothetical protein
VCAFLALNSAPLALIPFAKMGPFSRLLQSTQTTDSVGRRDACRQTARSDHTTGESFDMATAPAVSTSSARQPLSGHRPLFAGEDAAAYDSLLGRVSDVVKPADVLEEIWLQDVADLSWEVARLRRAKAEFLNSSAHRGLRKVLDGLLGWKEGQDLTAQ